MIATKFHKHYESLCKNYESSVKWHPHYKNYEDYETVQYCAALDTLPLIC